MKFITTTLLFSLAFLTLNAQTPGDTIIGCTACQPLGFNILDNGDFESGDTAFSTDLTNATNASCPSNSYIILDSGETNCLGLSLSDHTSGEGNFMLANASPFNDDGSDLMDPIIWSNNVFLLDQQNYNFSFWVYSLSGIDGQPDPFLEFTVNGAVVGSTSSLNDAPLNEGRWVKYCFDFFSENEADVEIAIQQTYSPMSIMGEATPFLLDDIAFSPVYDDAIPCELIVQYVPGTSDAQKDIIRSTYDITVQDSCVCGDIDLWLVNQFPMIVNGDTIIDIERLKLSSRDSADVQDVDFNYIVQNHAEGQASRNFGSPVMQTASFADGSDNECAVVVAIIDTGIDGNHNQLDTDIWQSGGPCPEDANNGYNFAYNDNNPEDDSNNGHGTHVAGIVDSFYTTYNPNSSYPLELIPVKAQDSLGKGTLFEIICSTLFSVDNGADVINMSLGYRGDSSTIMYNAIEKGLLDNEVLVVCSAGNDRRDNDLYGHYPSNLSNPNLIAVGADTTTENSAFLFSNYSCFGETTVDISAFGYMYSTLPDNQNGFLRGTSMAAPQIAAAAALAKPYYTGTGAAADIKNLILNSGLQTVNPQDTTSVSNRTFDITTFRNNLSNLTTPVVCDPTISIQEIVDRNSWVNISPNPTTGVLNVEIEGAESISHFLIYDIQGKLIGKQDNRNYNNQVNVEKLENGFYILEIVTDTYSARKKFIKR